MSASPQRPLRFVSHASPVTPVARKRQRLDAASTSSAPATPSIDTILPTLPFSPYRFNSAGNVVETVRPSGSAQKSLPSLPSAAAAMLALDADAHAIAKSVRAKEQDDKETKQTYGRHVDHYKTFWSTTPYAAGDPERGIAPLDAFPITVAKAVIFLRYESTRPQKKRKRKGEDHEHDEAESEASSVGVSSLKQAISALEHWRLNNKHLYKDVAEAQVSLRSDPSIKAFESAAAHKEPERVKMAHTLKAKGSSADTYTFDELIKCSVSCLTDSRGTNGIFVDMRDRAMLLTSTSVAFRGDSSRSLLWSDQFLFEVPILAKGLNARIPALTLIADNAKHNQNGRIEEYGAFRHRHVELCPVGAIAAHYFVWFHVLNCPVPDFKPDFSDPGYGQYGRRDWYKYHLFSHAKQADKPMSYDNHRDRINAIYAKNGITVSKITHGGRSYAVKVSREHGASVEGAKALGGWSESGSFRPCYDRALPVDAMLGAAMFDARRPEAHFLPRESLLPPVELITAIFPWVESEQMHLQAREVSNRFAKDIALLQFLRLMGHFRTVLIQDFAILFVRYPSCPIFKFPPFHSPCFHEFAAQSSARIHAVERQASLALANLPEHIAHTFRGAVSNLSLEHQRREDASRASMQELDDKISLMTGLLQQKMSNRNTRAKGELINPPTPAPPPPVSIGRAAIYPAHSLPPLPSTSDVFLAADSHPIQSPSSFCATPATPSKTCSESSLSSFAPASLSTDNHTIAVRVKAAQLSEWEKLTAKFNEDRLRLHQWEWITDSKDPSTGSYLPYYTFQPPSTLTGIWDEWASGLNGFLSVRDLDEHWGPKWRRDNSTLKSEMARRKKVINLMQRLSTKPNWNIELAHRFILTTFGDRFTPRKFCEYLQKKSEPPRIEEVLALSNSFIP